jgi:hypothetical protein
MQDKLPLLQTDYLISWDFSEKDLPVIIVTRIRGEGPNIIGDIIGRTHERAGCLSLRQVLEDYETRRREEEKRAAAIKKQLENWDKILTEDGEGEED